MFRTRITELLGIDYPILQGGMRWAARAELAAAVANAGGIGFISAHTQATAKDLASEIHRARALTPAAVGVNLTLLAANTGLDYDGYVAAIVDEGITAVETAGSNPARYIETLKRAGVKDPAQVRHRASCPEGGKPRRRCSEHRRFRMRRDIRARTTCRAWCSFRPLCRA